MTWLVLGADGQLGQELAAARGQQAVDAVFLGRRQCDIADAAKLRAVLDEVAPGIIINAAAYTNVDKAEDDAASAWRANRDGPALLAAEAAARGIVLVHVSTDFVFDGVKDGAYDEDDAVAPLGVYGQSKEAGEAEVRRRLDRHLIVRTGWLYGRFGHNFLKTMLRLAETRDSWGVVDDQWGTPTCSVDLAVALVAAARRAETGEARWGTYHFGGSGEATWHALAAEILRAAQAFDDRRPVIRAITSAEYPTRARRPRNSRLDSGLFAREFGVRAVPWQVRVAETVAILLRA